MITYQEIVGNSFHPPVSCRMLRHNKKKTLYVKIQIIFKEIKFYINGLAK